MNWIYCVEGFIRANETSVIFVLSALSLVMAICWLYLLGKVGKLGKRMKRPAAASESTLVVDAAELARRIDDSDQRIAKLVENHIATDQKLAYGIQRTGIVRFDAFPDVGGEQSFALAMLDRNLNGIVISNLYGRADSRVYAKEITEGRSQHALSNEEKEALRRATELPR